MFVHTKQELCFSMKRSETLRLAEGSIRDAYNLVTFIKLLIHVMSIIFISNRLF